MNTHTEILRIVATKYDAGESYSLSHEPTKSHFWYFNGKIITEATCLQAVDTKFLHETYQFHVEHLAHSWDCQLQYEIEHRGLEDSIGFDADALCQIYERHAQPGNLVIEFLVAYEVTSWAQQNNYGDKDSFIEYNLLGEIDLSRLLSIIVPISKPTK